MVSEELPLSDSLECKILAQTVQEGRSFVDRLVQYFEDGCKFAVGEQIWRRNKMESTLDCNQCFATD